MANPFNDASDCRRLGYQFKLADKSGLGALVFKFNSGSEIRRLAAVFRVIVFGDRVLEAPENSAN